MLVIKAFYETFKIKKNVISLICIVIFMLSMLMLAEYLNFFSSFINYSFIVGVMLPVTAIAPLQLAIEQDEKYNFNELLFTFPISKKKIVIEMYLINYTFLLINIMLALVIMGYYHYILNCITLSEGLIGIILGILVSLIIIPIDTACFISLGNVKGTVIYVLVAMILGAIYGASKFFITVSNTKIDYLLISIILFVSAIIITLISYKISLKMFIKRNS